MEPFHFLGDEDGCNIGKAAAWLTNLPAKLIGSKTRLQSISIQQVTNTVDAAIAKPISDEVVTADNEIYEIGHFSFSLTHPESNRPIVDSGNSFSIWQEDKDGRLKVKYTIFTTETHPSLR